MRAVNPYRPKPRGYKHCNDIQCVCGEKYKDFNSGITFASAWYATEGDFKSRRSVLWYMRVYKLTLWYATHRACGDLFYKEESNDQE